MCSTLCKQEEKWLKGIAHDLKKRLENGQNWV